MGRYARAGAQAVFNMSSSPWTWQKNDKRNRTVRDILERSPVPFLYVNHVGGQNNGKNIIVFDGDSTVYSPKGEILKRARPWMEELLLTGENAGHRRLGHEAQQQRRQRDAELGAREVQGEVA